jgi:hypothetical protein
VPEAAVQRESQDMDTLTALTACQGPGFHPAAVSVLPMCQRWTGISTLIQTHTQLQPTSCLLTPSVIQKSTYVTLRVQ